MQERIEGIATGGDASTASRRGRREMPPTARGGHDPSECISALQKAIRRGDEDGALHWAVELEMSGFGEWVFRRLRVIASEDVGLAEPGIASEVGALYTAWTDLRKKKDDRQEPWRLMLIHATLLLARARKSRIVDHALIYAYSDTERREIPDVALDKHTLAGKKRGRGWEHFWTQGTLLADPDTGELNQGSLPDPYREQAEAATMEQAR
jgi:replication-associated recombination protein RarA